MGRVNASLRLGLKYPEISSFLFCFGVDFYSVHPERTVFTLVCWFARWFVRYTDYDVSTSTRPVFTKLDRDVPHQKTKSNALLTFERSRSQFKVKAYLHMVISQPSLRYIHQIWQCDRYWATRSNFGMKCHDFRQSSTSRRLSDGGLRSVSGFEVKMIML